MQHINLCCFLYFLKTERVKMYLYATTSKFSYYIRGQKMRITTCYVYINITDMQETIQYIHKILQHLYLVNNDIVHTRICLHLLLHKSIKSFCFAQASVCKRV